LGGGGAFESCAHNTNPQIKDCATILVNR
jgi:hypothetical protein